MGATRNTGYIENLIAYDGSDNIGIGSAVNVLYKVTIGGNTLVSGTLNVNSSVTASSFVKTGGTASQILAADGSVITAGTNITISGGTISAGDVGFANPMTTLGDIIYGAASGTATRLAGNTTTTKKYLVQTGDGTVSAAPSWGTISSGDVSFGNQTANTVFSGPTTGAAAAPTFRALVAADIPSLSYLPLAGGTMSGPITINNTQPLIFIGGSNSGSFNRTSIYVSQNNTSGNTANGVFVERGRLTDAVDAEVRYFVIGSRGGQIQWMADGTGYTTQYNSAEVKPSGDGNFFIGRHSGSENLLFRAYQSSGDGYIDLGTGAGSVVTKLSGYTGTPNYTLAKLGIGKSSSITYMLDVDGGSTNNYAASFVKQAYGAEYDGAIARFINNIAEGYSSYILIGSNPGTDWKIGKNISAPTTAVYNFEIVDSSNNLRMSINAVSGNTTFNGNITATSLIKSGGTSSQFLKADGSIDSNSYITGNQNITLSGDVTGSGATSIVTTIGEGKVTNAMLAGSITASKLATFGSGDAINWAANTDSAFIKFVSTGDAEGESYLEIGTGDNGNEPIRFTQRSGAVTYTRLSIGADGELTKAGGNYYVYASGATQNYVPLFEAGLKSITSSKISQPDGNNITVNFADTYAQGGKFSYVSTYVSKLLLGRTGTGQTSNVDLIYDIEGAEVFEIRRNYSDAVFKISLGATAHLTIAKTGAATFNSTVTAGGIVTAPIFMATNRSNTVDPDDGVSNNFQGYGGYWALRTDTSNSFNLDVYGNGTPINALNISQVTGAATFKGNITIEKGSPIIRLSGSAFGNSGAGIRFEGWSSASGYSNWQIDTAFTGGNELCFVPSTTGGGSTFTTPVFKVTSGGIGVFSSYLAATYATLSSTQPLVFTGGSNTGTFNQTTIYSAQNNTSGSTANGIFIERGRLTDSGSAEVRHFVIGARGGQIQWKCDGVGYTTQNGTSEVKPSGDGDYFVGRFSGGSAKCFVAYQSGADGYLELRTGANNTVTKLSGYTGTIGYTLAPFSIGQTTQSSGAILSVLGTSLAANFATNQTGAGSGLCAYFVNNAAGGYSSFIYIGSAPGTDWKIGKNISNPTGATYHFEIVDSSNNLRMRINNSTGAVTFSNTVTATGFFEDSDSRIKELIEDNYKAIGIETIKPKLYKKGGKIELGYFAQDVQPLLSNAVTIGENGYLTLSYREVHTAKIAALEERVKELEEQLKQK